MAMQAPAGMPALMPAHAYCVFGVIGLAQNLYHGDIPAILKTTTTAPTEPPLPARRRPHASPRIPLRHEACDALDRIIDSNHTITCQPPADFYYNIALISAPLPTSTFLAHVIIAGSLQASSFVRAITALASTSVLPPLTRNVGALSIAITCGILLVITFILLLVRAQPVLEQDAPQARQITGEQDQPDKYTGYNGASAPTFTPESSRVASQGNLPEVRPPIFDRRPIKISKLGSKMKRERLAASASQVRALQAEVTEDETESPPVASEPRHQNEAPHETVSQVSASSIAPLEPEPTVDEIESLPVASEPLYQDEAPRQAISEVSASSIAPLELETTRDEVESAPVASELSHEVEALHEAAISASSIASLELETTEGELESAPGVSETDGQDEASRELPVPASAPEPVSLEPLVTIPASGQTEALPAGDRELGMSAPPPLPYDSKIVLPEIQASSGLIAHQRFVGVEAVHEAPVEQDAEEMEIEIDAVDDGMDETQSAADDEMEDNLEYDQHDDEMRDMLADMDYSSDEEDAPEDQDMNGLSDSEDDDLDMDDDDSLPDDFLQQLTDALEEEHEQVSGYDMPNADDRRPSLRRAATTTLPTAKEIQAALPARGLDRATLLVIFCGRVEKEQDDEFFDLVGRVGRLDEEEGLYYPRT